MELERGKGGVHTSEIEEKEGACHACHASQSLCLFLNTQSRKAQNNRLSQTRHDLLVLTERLHGGWNTWRSSCLGTVLNSAHLVGFADGLELYGR